MDISLRRGQDFIRPAVATVRAHSTRGIVESWANFRGCMAAGWALPHTYIKLYHLGITMSAVTHAVVEVGGSVWEPLVSIFQCGSNFQ